MNFLYVISAPCQVNEDALAIKERKYVSLALRFINSTSYISSETIMKIKVNKKNYIERIKIVSCARNGEENEIFVGKIAGGRVGKKRMHKVKVINFFLFHFSLSFHSQFFFHSPRSTHKVQYSEI
jgi:hypothetical protein